MYRSRLMEAMADNNVKKFSIHSLLLCCNNEDKEEDTNLNVNRVVEQQHDFTYNINFTKGDEDAYQWVKDEAEEQKEEEEEEAENREEREDENVEEEEDECQTRIGRELAVGDDWNEHLMFTRKFWWPPFLASHSSHVEGGRAPAMLWSSLLWPQTSCFQWTNPLFPTAAAGIVEPSSFANNSGAFDELLVPKSPIVVVDERGRGGQLQGQQEDDNIQENKMLSLHHDESSSSSTSNNKRVGHPYQNRQVASCKKPRTSFTKQQVSILERRFVEQKYLASSERAQLADQLGMDDAQVKTWFQNRRTKWRRQEAEERQFDKNGSSSCAAGISSSSYFFALANNAPTLSHKLKSFPM